MNRNDKGDTYKHLSRKTFLDIKGAFNNTPPGLCSRIVFGLYPVNIQADIDEKNVTRPEDKILLSMLDEFGLNYTLETGVRGLQDSSKYREDNRMSFLIIHVPYDWSNEYQAISRRIAEFEAKQ